MTDREHAVYDLARLGIYLGNVEAILRDLSAVQRAHEAECCAWPEDMVRAFSERGDRAFARIVGCIGKNDQGRLLQVRRQRDPRGCTVAIYARDVNTESGEPLVRLGVAGFTGAQMARLDKVAEYRTAEYRKAKATA